MDSNVLLQRIYMYEWQLNMLCYECIYKLRIVWMYKKFTFTEFLGILHY